MSEKRLSVIKHAFQFLDVNRERKLKIQDLLRLYHADVIHSSDLSKI